MVNDRRWRRILAPWILLAVLLAAAGFWYATVYRDRVIRDNERHAYQARFTLARAEYDFIVNDRDGNGKNDFWGRDVSGLFGRGLADRALAEADVRPVRPLVAKPNPWHGYFVAALDTTPLLGEPIDPYFQPRYAFCVFPAEPGVTGNHIYIIDEGPTIRRCHVNDRPVPTRWPSQKELAFWTNDCGG